MLAAYNLVANIFVLLAFNVKKEIAMDNAYILEGIQILTILAYVRIFSERRKNYKKKLKFCSFKFAQPQNNTLADSSDSVQVFMDLLTKKTKEESINLVEIHEIYQLWFTSNEYEALDYQEFTERIKELEYTIEERYDGMHLIDVALIQSY